MIISLAIPLFNRTGIIKRRHGHALYIKEQHTHHSPRLQFLPIDLYSCSIKVFHRRNREAQTSLACVLVKGMKQSIEGSPIHKGLEVLYWYILQSNYHKISIDWKINYHIRKSAHLLEGLLMVNMARPFIIWDDNLHSFQICKPWSVATQFRLKLFALTIHWYVRRQLKEHRNQGKHTTYLSTYFSYLR